MSSLAADAPAERPVPLLVPLHGDRHEQDVEGRVAHYLVIQHFGARGDADATRANFLAPGVGSGPSDRTIRTPASSTLRKRTTIDPACGLLRGR